MGFASRRVQKKLVRKLKRMSSDDLAGWHVATKAILVDRLGEDGFSSLIADKERVLSG